MNARRKTKIIHGSSGLNVITGGTGGDELWGDFGLNTFKGEKDGQSIWWLSNLTTTSTTG